MASRCKAAGKDPEITPSNGTVILRNPNLESLPFDVLYHIGLDSRIHDLKKMFGDVRYVCMGGTKERMKIFALFIMEQIGIELPTGAELTDLSQHSHRYAMYKVGPVLCVSHGMGIPSISILLHELIKLMFYAKCKDPVFFRIGTCGGIGLPPGTVVVSDGVVDGKGEPYYELSVLGEPLRRPSTFDQDLMNELVLLNDPLGAYQIVSGTTMCAIDFYEGQGRLDGAFCEYTNNKKMNYLRDLQKVGIRNMEMEGLALAALTHEAGIRAAQVCVTLLDRLQDDQIHVSKEEMKEWEKRPQELVALYIKNTLSVSKS